MSKWTKTTLGKIADIITGPFGSQLHQSDYVKRGIPIVMPQDIGNRNINYSTINYVSEEDATRLKRYSTVTNDILYARRGDVEKHAFVRAKDAGVLCGTGCLRVRINSNEVESAFLSFYLNREETRKWLVTHAVGTNMPNLNTDILSDVPIAYPTLKEQRKIVKVLNCLEERIVLNEKINDNLEQQAKLIYDYWFTQFDFPDEDGKPYCSSGGKMVWNEQLKRNIPENWKVAQLKDIFNVSGKPISRDDCQTDAYYTPIDVIPKRTITFAGGLSAAEANSSLQVYEENNILLGAMRVYFHRVCISAQSGITRTTTLVLKPKVDEYLGYAYQVLNDDNAILYATQHSSGTQQPYIKWNDVLENYRFAMPSNPKLLYEYSKISEPLITKAKNCARETEQLRKLRDWLLPMLMNGQATIND